MAGGFWAYWEVAVISLPGAIVLAGTRECQCDQEHTISVKSTNASETVISGCLLS